MNQEIDNEPIDSDGERVKRWLRKAFLDRRRISWPVTFGLFCVVATQLIPATSSSLLWFLHSWGAYIGAIAIAYGVFPVIANLDDEDSEGPVPPSF